ncbi:YihY/virulence factor BrkB family protein [Sphingomonas nostoxanthinifaciens]|uniref:YihY/virulence factor BrkB family protein n=1 Tax=Sphingomonas nostoxanthinifaciens TaxID=2872652 RepID=UPI001CC1D8CD|nr:YihY/virulence factor BrkB family protein [Sphingomonas nostoxanthinifaciens]UAK24719.1 YihY/virulence factor BrkB family protein [Sphingomonas nostoxanthinifaciens]
MHDASPISPEERAGHGNPQALAALSLPRRAWEIVRRVVVGVYADGFIHAGNLAYLALVSLFPFFIATAALAHGLGRGADTTMAVDSFLRELPKSVRELLRQPITDVLAQRTGSLLWLGGLLGLWTTGSFIETIRDILRRAYGTQSTKSFWRYRIGSTVLIMGAVVATLIAFSLQLLLTGVEEFVARLLPVSDEVIGWIGWSRLAPAVALFGALYLIFFSLTPSRYREVGCLKWPGAMFTALWWVLATTALPAVLAQLGGYDRTYGSLAGVIVALLFFWLVGFGLVIGAHLNAALAETPSSAIRGPHQPAEG